MLEQEELRKKAIKENAEKVTKQTEKPFSFHERDKVHKEELLRKLHAEKQQKEESEKFVFRAAPMPWFGSLKLYRRKQEEEEDQRQMRRKIRQNWLRMNSKLPPRMQEAIKKQMKNKIETKAIMEDHYAEMYKLTFKPSKARDPPNFEAIHRKFQKKLQKSKMNKKVTKPKSPKFRETKKKVEYEYFNETVQ